MKNTTILFLIFGLFSFLLPRQSYGQDLQTSLDSIINSQKKTITQANASLSYSLKVKPIEGLSKKKSDAVIKLKRQSMELVRAANESKDFHEQLNYLNNALRKYNKAQKVYNNVLILKKF